MCTRFMCLKLNSSRDHGNEPVGTSHIFFYSWYTTLLTETGIGSGTLLYNCYSFNCHLFKFSVSKSKSYYD
jgi:hypothetical protein